jgi:hypothetical protein
MIIIATNETKMAVPIVNNYSSSIYKIRLQFGLVTSCIIISIASFVNCSEPSTLISIV